MKHRPHVPLKLSDIPFGGWVALALLSGFVLLPVVLRVYALYWKFIMGESLIP